MAMIVGQTYEIPEGDGDPQFFGVPRRLRLIEEPWFHGVKDWPGKAFLFKVDGGAYDSQFVALSPRTSMSIEEGIASHNLVSIIVHLVLRPGPGFEGTEEDSAAIGMATLERA
tara:strand:- start:108 stop:446 length:339 start_codon:yes stop_codon:yes gene_type:complete